MVNMRGFFRSPLGNDKVREVLGGCSRPTCPQAKLASLRRMPTFILVDLSCSYSIADPYSAIRGAGRMYGVGRMVSELQPVHVEFSPRHRKVRTSGNETANFPASPALVVVRKQS